jgi:hypothetical protein
MDQQSVFINEVRLQFDRLFQAKKAGQNVLALKHRLKAFFMPESYWGWWIKLCYSN